MSTVDPRGAARGELLHVGQRRHRGVARRRHRQRAVRRAVVDRLLGVVEGHEAVDEPGGKRVPAADAVVDLEAGTLRREAEPALVPAERRPVVDRGRLHRAERGCDRLEVRELGPRALDHPPEALHRQRGEVGVHPLHLDAERGGEVLLVADHHVHVLRDLSVHLLRPRLAADRLPQRRAVVEVVARHRAVRLRGLERLDRHLGGRLGERGENAAGVEPPHALLAEKPLPVDHARLELADRRQPAVGAAPRAAAAEAALDEVEPVADGPADAVVRRPDDVRDVHPALEHEVLHQTPDRIVGERGHRRRPHAEAAPEASHHVVLAAALPDLELARGVNASVAGVEPQHDLAERRGVPPAVSRRLDLERIVHLLFLLSKSAAPELPHDLAVVERMLHAGDLLRGLVALACDDDDIPLLRLAERKRNRLAPVGLAHAPGPLRHAARHRRDDRERVLAARIVGGDDHAVRATRRRRAHQRALHRVAVAAGAEHHPEPARGESARRRQHLVEPVRRVREVDVHLRRDLGVLDALEPSPARLQPRNHRLHRPARHSRGLGKRRRDEHVRAVVLAHERQPREVVGAVRDRDADHIDGEVAGGVEHLARALAVQRHHERRQVAAAHVRPRLSHARHLLRQLQLRREIRLHRLVVVEMVLGEIGERAAGEARLAGAVLAERVGRDLHHAVGAAVRLHRRENLPELLERRGGVAGREAPRAVEDLDGGDIAALPPGNGVHELGEDPGGRRLAVGAGYPPDAHLSPHALPAREPLRRERTVFRAGAAVHERVDGDAAARSELAVDLHVLRLQQPEEVVVDQVHHVLVEIAAVAEAEEVELERLRLDEFLCGNVADGDGREVRLAGLGAERGELRRGERHPVVAPGIPVRERLQHLRRVAGRHLRLRAQRPEPAKISSFASLHRLHSFHPLTRVMPTRH